jgi:hypothetical protein
MLSFEQGASASPRGHALFYLRSASEPGVVLVSYLMVLPLTVDMTRYLPPFLAQSLGAGQGGGLAGEQGAIAWPPIPERFESHERLRALATARGDDLIDGGTINPDQVEALVSAVGRAASEYFSLYSSTTAAALDAGSSEASSAEDSAASLDVDEVLYSLLGDHERLSELVKLVGVLRDAVESGDRRRIEQSTADLQKLGRHLAPKYRFEALLSAATRTGERGRRLAELYVERCYRVANEDYAGLGDVETRIESLEAES